MKEQFKENVSFRELPVKVMLCKSIDYDDNRCNPLFVAL